MVSVRERCREGCTAVESSSQTRANAELSVILCYSAIDVSLCRNEFIESDDSMVELGTLHALNHA